MWKYLLLTLIHVLIYDSWEEKAWKPKQCRVCSRHWGKLPALTDVHREQREPQLGQGRTFPTDRHPSLLSPPCSLSFFSSSQCFHNIFIALVACGNFARQGVCYRVFLAHSPLSLWVLSQQRVVRHVKQPILICLHLVLYRGIWIAPESYLSDFQGLSLYPVA